MYTVGLKHFDSNGHFLGDDEILSPNKSQRTLMEYVRGQGSREFYGFRPVYIYACPETGSPVLTKVGD